MGHPSTGVQDHGSQRGDESDWGTVGRNGAVGHTR